MFDGVSVRGLAVAGLDVTTRADDKIGAGTRNRTADLLITNQSLYQLSYPGNFATTT